MSQKKSVPLVLLLASLTASSVHGFEADTASDAVFDLYFFGNGEIGQLGENLSYRYERTGLDSQQVAGWVDWTDGATQSTQSYWTADQKQAVIEAVNAWTSVIGNAYGDYQRKMRIGFFLDDASRSASLMDVGMSGYASYASTSATPSGNAPTNFYSTVEWLWRDGKSAIVNPPSSASSGSFWNYNLLPDQADCIEVAIVLNPEKLVFANGTASTEAMTQEEIKRVTMHELGHAMGMDSKLFTSGGHPTLLASTWDSLLMLDENQRIVTLDGNGKLVYTYDSFQALCEAGWSKYQEYYTSGSGEEKLLRVQNENGDSALVLVTAGENAAGNSLVHLLGELGIENHEDVLGPSGLQGSVFTEIDLAALRALGWQVIPEPSAFGLFAGLVALAFCAARRRRKN